MLVSTYNIHRGRGPLGLFRPNRILEVIAEIRPDIIALQEAQHYFRRDKHMLNGAIIRRELGLKILSLPEYPRQQGWRSNLVLVRHDAKVLYGPVGLRLGGLEPRGAILAELDLGRGPFRLLSAHFSLSENRRLKQAERLLEAMHTGRGRRIPTLLMGDFNEWRSDAPALNALASVFGTAPDIPTFPSFFPRFALDRIMAEPAGLLSNVEPHDTPLARCSSDHLPLKARFQ